MQIPSSDLNFRRVSKVLLNMSGKKYLIMLSSEETTVITLIDKNMKKIQKTTL